MTNSNQILTRVLLFLVLSCFTLSTFAQGTWASKPNYGGVGREGAVSFSIGSNIYMGTGLATGGVFKDDLWQYNGTAWTQMANFPGGARSQAVGFTINNKGYIATGYLIQAGQNVNMSDLWEYTPSTNTWVQKQSLPAQGRSEAVGFSVGGKGYISTGYYYSQPTALGLNDTWEYDPTLNNWTQKANFPGGNRYGGVGFAANSKGYVGTGRYADPNPPYTISYFSDFWEFNPTSNQWVQKTSFPGVARHRSVGFQLCDYGYVGIGQDQSGNSLTDFYRYDVVSNAWTQVANYGGGFCHSATAAVMNNKGYVGTGKFGFGVGQIFQEYTPATACVNPCALNAPAGADKNVCVGASVQIGSTPVAGYLYSWSPATGLSSTSIGNPLASPTANTTYIVSISNSAGCYQTDTVVVTVKSSPTANAGVDKTICAGTSTTIGTTAVTGNTYSWSPATGLSSITAAIPTATPASTTIYTLTVTNTSTGCSAQDQVSVTVLSAPGSAGADKTICAGSTTTIGPTAVTGTFYSWSPATGLSSTTVANPIASPSVTTNYVLLSQNSSGCTSTDTVKVVVNPLPTANAGLDQSICFGTGTTIGSVAISGMTYSWTPSTGLSSTTTAQPFAQPSSTITYTVTVTNSATGCTKQDAMLLTVLPGPVANAGADKTICAGSSTTIGTTATTGITYSWSPSTGLSSTTAAVPTANPTTTTTYILTTSNGSCSTIDSVKVTVNPAPTANAGLDKTICNGVGVTIGTAAVTGNTYSWSPATGLNSATAATPTATPTATTTYTLTVTNTATGCTKTDAVIVTIGTAPTANAGLDKAICVGSSTTIGTTAVTGNTYSWSPATGLSSATVAVPTATPTATTTYTLTVTNASGCTATDAVVVTVNPLPTANAGLDKTICAGTSTTIGTAAITGNTYSWSPTTGLSSATVAVPTATPTATTTYTLTVTNTATGCTSTDVVIVTVGTAPTANAGLDKSICIGANTTIGTAAVAGNTYSWSPATGLSSTTIAVPTATPTTTTTYTLTVTNAAGCTATDVVVVTVNPLPTANAGADKTICAGASTTIGSTAATGVSYAWSPTTGLSSSTVATPTATPTVTTNYIVTVSNTFGCTRTDTVKVTVNPLPTANAGVDKSICGGAGTTIGTAAVSGNTYSWSPSTGLSSATVAVPTANPSTTTTYTLTVTNTVTGCTNTDVVIVTVGAGASANAGADKTICGTGSVTIGSAAVTGVTYSWTPSTGLSSATVANPTASPTVTTTYIVTATNGGCTAKDTVIVTVSALPTANAGVDKAICAANSTTIGTAAITGNTYTWTPATGLSSATIAVPTATPTATTTYTLTVTNAAGCTATDAVIVTVNPLPTANAGADKSICGGNSTTIGTAAVTGNTYSWSPATGLSSANAAIPTATPTVTTTYTLTVTNTATGCTSTDVVIVTVGAGATANAGADKTICQAGGVSIGSAAVTGVTYSWTPSTGLSSSTVANPIASPTLTTTYIVTVTSGNCVDKDTVIVTVSGLPVANAGVDKTVCAGTGVVIGTTAVAGTTYSWTPTTGLSSSTIANPTATPTATTSYILTATNGAGCTKTDTVKVVVNPLPTANAGVDKTLCTGTSTTIGSAAVAGNTYSWTPSTGLSSATVAVPTATPSVTTTYTLTVTNTTTGCTKTDVVIVTVTTTPVANAGADKSLCLGSSTSIGVAATAGFTYSWTPSIGLSSATVANPTATPTVTTTYILTVTNGACVDKDTVIVTVNAIPTANAGVDKTICNGSNVQIGSASVSGLTYSWTPSTGLSSTTISNPIASPTVTTSYILTVSNAAGCSKKDTVKVIVSANAAPVANAGTDKTICPGECVQIGSGAAAGINYSWTPTTNLMPTNTSDPIAHPIATTSYVVTAIDPLTGCFDKDTVIVNVVAGVTANAGPDKTISAGGTTPIGALAVQGVSYVWSPAVGLSSPNVSNPTASPSVTTTYIVTAINNATGCSDKDTMIVTVSGIISLPGFSGARTTHISTPLADNLQVYPNPVNAVLNVNSLINLEGKYEIRLYNALGQAVYEADMNLQSEVLSLQISVQSFSKGIYQLVIRNADIEIMRKVVKE